MDSELSSRLSESTSLVRLCAHGAFQVGGEEWKPCNAKLSWTKSSFAVRERYSREFESNGSTLSKIKPRTLSKLKQ